MDVEKLKKESIGHARKIALLLINVLFNRRSFFALIGWLGRLRGEPIISTVFVAYPADEEYANAYVYASHRHWMRWRPWPAGLFFQNGRVGLMTVISAMEIDFLDRGNRSHLERLVEHTRRMADLLGAKRISFAGILPGVLDKRKIAYGSTEADVTVAALIQAESSLRSRLGWQDNVPIILLGGKGYIGMQLMDRLSRQGREVYVVDGNGARAHLEQWPNHLVELQAIAINLTRKSVVDHYSVHFWKNLVLLNEVYPEPDEVVIADLALKGCKAFHLVGVNAKSWPAFPKAYQGGIPCCAAMVLPGMEVILKELKPRRRNA